MIYLLALLIFTATAAADTHPETTPMDTQTATATFAGGCFWCMEHPFDSLPGVSATTSGYTGGSEPDPTYRQVAHGHTTHAESIQITYDPNQVTYETLLQTFWHNIDPTQTDGQFCDRGPHYRTAIFYHDETQKQLALDSKAVIEQSKRFAKPIATRIVPATPFYPAEEYHQDYYLKNPDHYAAYRRGCGRDRRLQELWGTAPNH